jgi:hypothetical protein
MAHRARADDGDLVDHFKRSMERVARSRNSVGWSPSTTVAMAEAPTTIPTLRAGFSSV